MRYIIRRAVISLPVFIFFVHQFDKRGLMPYASWLWASLTVWAVWVALAAVINPY